MGPFQNYMTKTLWVGWGGWFEQQFYAVPGLLPPVNLFMNVLSSPLKHVKHEPDSASHFQLSQKLLNPYTSDPTKISLDFENGNYALQEDKPNLQEAFAKT